MTVLENEPLSRHTTLRVGGPARFWTEVRTLAELRAALAFAQTRALPVAVLGQGANVLVSDAGFDGLVVKMATCGVQVLDQTGSRAVVVAEAGQEWDRLVAWAVEQGLGGLENLSAIPGSVGGAVVGNIGAYGVELGQRLLWVEALDRRTGAVRLLPKSACQLGYRHSLFKTPEGRAYIVLRAAFELRTDAAPQLTYADLQEYFGARGAPSPTLAQVRQAILAIRRQKLPDVTQMGTAGSFFKNPIVPRTRYEALAERYPGLPGYEVGPDQVKVPLGWILDKVCHLKGVRRDAVGTYPHQALVVVNYGATARQIEAFAAELAAAIRAATGLEPEWEVERLG